MLPEAEIKADADLFAKEGLKVSFVNTGLLKFTWPGTEPARRRPETPEAREKRIAAEKVRWDAAHGRSAEGHPLRPHHGLRQGPRLRRNARGRPRRPLYQMIADTLGELSKLAEKEKVYLLLENEGSQNIATAQELADVMKLIPSKWVGFNWDPHNAYGKEKAYPDGYDAPAQSSAC